VGHIFLGMIKGSFTCAIRSVLSDFPTCLKPNFNFGPVVSGELSGVFSPQNNTFFPASFSEMAELVWSPGNICVGKPSSKVRCGKAVNN